MDTQGVNSYTVHIAEIQLLIISEGAKETLVLKITWCFSVINFNRRAKYSEGIQQIQILSVVVILNRSLNR